MVRSMMYGSTDMAPSAPPSPTHACRCPAAHPSPARALIPTSPHATLDDMSRFHVSWSRCPSALSLSGLKLTWAAERSGSAPTTPSIIEQLLLRRVRSRGLSTGDPALAATHPC
ncbi:hypothetical protein HaLaN_12203 [Haematococcus lacustris]|uniref:Uncharacterized protein n=1 Tax=Haematococcus lacustris TaxID=44745 RepID=A0A699Z9J1_HAELA|nr:hypothetical protein HaLaN_12203 [Haematococcus lacustris]